MGSGLSILWRKFEGLGFGMAVRVCARGFGEILGFYRVDSLFPFSCTFRCDNVCRAIVLKGLSLHLLRSYKGETIAGAGVLGFGCLGLFSLFRALGLSPSEPLAFTQD